MYNTRIYTKISKQFTIIIELYSNIFLKKIIKQKPIISKAYYINNIYQTINFYENIYLYRS